MSALANAAAEAAPSRLILLRDDIEGVALLTLNDPDTRQQPVGGNAGSARRCADGDRAR